MHTCSYGYKPDTNWLKPFRYSCVGTEKRLTSCEHIDYEATCDADDVENAIAVKCGKQKLIVSEILIIKFKIKFMFYL